MRRSRASGRGSKFLRVAHPCVVRISNSTPPSQRKWQAAMPSVAYAEICPLPVMPSHLSSIRAIQLSDGTGFRPHPVFVTELESPQVTTLEWLRSSDRRHLRWSPPRLKVFRLDQTALTSKGILSPSSSTAALYSSYWLADRSFAKVAALACPSRMRLNSTRAADHRSSCFAWHAGSGQAVAQSSDRRLAAPRTPGCRAGLCGSDR